MTPPVRANLKRLLAPRHAVFVGGREAEIAINACQRIGFQGALWAVNPRRKSLGGVACHQDVNQLPEAPDAVFLAVPPLAAIEVVAQLAQRGAGGVVCYTAGFSEGGEGGDGDRPLVEAAGDMAVIGPNCYGFINYLHPVALWPFAHAGYCPGFGAAIITQSGMLASDITMNRRSLPLAYLISAGNQSALGLEDYIEVLCERDQVRAIGLHIEGLKDVPAFSRAARKALECGKPVVALKTGTSKIGARLTASHTGSLSGVNELNQALFDRLGIIRVASPAQLLETLKFICVSGIPAGNRVMGFTCSGGGAALLADYAQETALKFPQPSARATVAMKKWLPGLAEVSNPLDYTTPIWGTEKVRPVFDAAVKDACDAALILQDFPLPEVAQSMPSYLSDTRAFIAAVAEAGVPGAVCSTFSENIDRQTREELIKNKITPLQGICEAVHAVAGAAWYGRRREFVLDHRNGVSAELVSTGGGELRANDEWRSKALLRGAGVDVPEGRLTDAAGAGRAARELGFPLVLKINDPKILHKTEIGAVRLGLESVAGVEAAVSRMRDDLGRAASQSVADCFLLERMLPPPLAELMLNIRADPQFGLAMTLSAGGVWVEMLDDATTLLLPVGEAEILAALGRLKIAPLLDGFRGNAAANRTHLAGKIKGLADYLITHKARIGEIEINPLFVYAETVCAVDAVVWNYAGMQD